MMVGSSGKTGAGPGDWQSWSGDGKVILIVEDEFLIALEIQGIVETFGCSVLGPASTVEGALELLKTATPDAALLDANLRGEQVTPVAAACRERGIPFVIVTGYGRLTIDEPLVEQAPRVRKPFMPDDIRGALADLALSC